MLLVVSMFSHDFFINPDIVNVSEKQKYISVVAAAAVVVVVVVVVVVCTPLSLYNCKIKTYYPYQINMLYKNHYLKY